MNNTFDIKRFGNYYLYELKNIWKNNGMLLLIFAFIPVIFYMLYMIFGTLFSGDLELIFTDSFQLNGPGLAVRLPILVCMAMIFTAIFPSRAYGHLTEKGRGTSWLMVPASRLEKFLSLILNCIITIPAAFLLTYTISDWIVCLFDKSCGFSILGAFFYDQNSWNSEYDNFILCGNGIWILFSSMLNTSVTFILGTLVFKKWKVLGTILWTWILGIVLSIVIGVLVNMVSMDGLEAAVKRLEPWFVEQAPYMDIWFNTITNIFISLWVALTLSISWLRIKKLQH